MKEFIVGIGHTRETVGIIDLEVVPAGVCRVIVTTEQESYTEGSTFGIADTLHVGETRIIYLTFILKAEDVLEGEGPRGIKFGRSFVGL